MMSVLLLSSSLVTATLIDAERNEEHGRGTRPRIGLSWRTTKVANGVCPLFGEAFGTIYDMSTVVILELRRRQCDGGLVESGAAIPATLWHGAGMGAGRAAAGDDFYGHQLVRDVVLPRRCRGPRRRVRHRRAGVDFQRLRGDGHRSLRTSEAVYGLWKVPWRYVLITAVFFYTTAANMIERPDGVEDRQLLYCLGGGVCRSGRGCGAARKCGLVGFEFVSVESRFLWDSLKHLEFPVLVPHRPGTRDLAKKEQIIRERHRIADEVPIVFIEAEVGDPSEFQQMPLMEVRESEGRFVIARDPLRFGRPRDRARSRWSFRAFGKPPEVHFGWSNENPMSASISFLLFGEGNVPWMVRELIRKAEPDPEKQPEVFIG